MINDAVNQSKLTSDTPVKTPLNNKKWNDFALNLWGEKQQNDAWSGSLLSGMVLSIWLQQLDCWLYSTTYVINDAVNQSKLTSDTPVKTPLNNKKWNDFALNLWGEKQ